ncbi:chromosomal replication initiator protein DnaA [Candidatus Berkelbacteria bacterium]|nr:chromosomal replication initiator protein DnaA [Candidatus Berkelbacteria bacterium]
MELAEIWQIALGELEVVISPPMFKTWFLGTNLEGYGNGIAVIRVASPWAKEQLEQRNRGEIIGVLRKHLPDITTIECMIKTPETSLPPRVTQEQRATGIPFSSQNNRLKPEYVFDNFVVGTSNRFAFAAAKTVAENPGKIHNPLFIYGGVGLGKTHLICAIGNEIMRQSPSVNISYVSCEDFTNEFVQSLQNRTVDNFKQKYRNVDVFLVDDIQFLARKEGTQEEFFHTFNALHQQNRQIVMTADRLPKAIPDLEDRLSSRFGWGMVADIHQPNLETREAILLEKCGERGVTLTQEIIDFLAQNFTSNIRDLEGALNRIIGYCELNHLAMNMENVKKALEAFVDQNQLQIAPDKVIDSVCRFFGTKRDDILGKKRSKELVYPRQIAMYLLRHEANLTYPQIGRALGGKDHTTIIHGCNVITREISRSEQLRSEINHIKELITSPGFT